MTNWGRFAGDQPLDRGQGLAALSRKGRESRLSDHTVAVVTSQTCAWTAASTEPEGIGVGPSSRVPREGAPSLLPAPPGRLRLCVLSQFPLSSVSCSSNVAGAGEASRETHAYRCPPKAPVWEAWAPGGGRKSCGLLRGGVSCGHVRGAATDGINAGLAGVWVAIKGQSCVLPALWLSVSPGDHSYTPNLEVIHTPPELSGSQHQALEPPQL